MTRRSVLDSAAIVTLPVVALAALVFLGGTVDPCLAPNPGCGVHEGTWPFVVIPAVILWLIAVVDHVRTRRTR